VRKKRSGPLVDGGGARDPFLLAHRVLGTVVGETLGYLLTAAWTLLVLVALGRGIRRWFTALGAVSAVLIVSGVLTPLQPPLVDDANFIGYVMWSVWLVVFAIWDGAPWSSKTDFQVIFDDLVAAVVHGDQASAGNGLSPDSPLASCDRPPSGDRWQCGVPPVAKDTPAAPVAREPRFAESVLAYCG
jgi:hypothetical protein